MNTATVHLKEIIFEFHFYKTLIKIDLVTHWNSVYAPGLAQLPSRWEQMNGDL